MDILFVNPPARTQMHETIVVPPMGLAYVAAAARGKGYTVEILDAFALGLSWDEFAQHIKKRTYDFIGLTGMTPVIDTVAKAAAICRPATTTLVLGGAHATVAREAVFSAMPEFDYAIIGEGEETIVELLEALSVEAETKNIAGLMDKAGNFAGERKPVNGIDRFPFPARDLLPNHLYRYPLCSSPPMTTMITSRGCPFPCIFCDKGVFGSRWRARSAENVLAEIDLVVKTYGVRSLVIYDDLFTLNAERLEAICEGLIERDYDLSWKAEGRVDTVDEEMLALMRKAGCDTIAYGVESANQQSLDYLCKKTTPDAVRKAFAMTHRAGIKSMGYFILGIPVETYDDALNTIRFACELDADYAQFSILSPLPGTKLYTDALANNWYREVKAHNIHDKDLLRPAIVSANWTEEKLDRIIHEAHRKFFMRPGYILKKLKDIKNLRQLSQTFGYGIKTVAYLLKRQLG